MKDIHKETSGTSSGAHGEASLVKSETARREEEILEFWKAEKIFERSLKKEAPKGEFVFYEGPPTANGRPGIHHLEARAFKDVIPRFKTMQGYRVDRKAGWDTHGLPVEIGVEKKLGISGKLREDEEDTDRNCGDRERKHSREPS